MDALEIYIRSGEVTKDLRRIPDGGYVLPDEWFGSVRVPLDKTAINLYAMPAATAGLLQDPSVNIRDWITSEVKRTWDEQMADADLDSVGPTFILRDPYSAKPYILFYISAQAFRSDAVAA